MNDNNTILSLKKLLNERKIEISQLQAIIDDLPGDVYWKHFINGNLVYLGMNKAGINSLHKMGFNWNKEDILGKPDSSLFDKETAASFLKNDLAVIHRGNALTQEEAAILPSGKKIIQVSTKRPLLDLKGNCIGISGVSIDITELKETQANLQIALEKAEAANHAKTEFLENMRHDIRTPLTGIVGCAELLEDIKNPEQIKELTNDLVQSSNALLDFLNKILEGIKVATGEIPLVKKKFDLRKQLTAIIHLNQALAAEKQLSLQFDYDEQIPQYVIGDPVRVERIVLELMTNALTFTQKGTVHLGVQLKKKEGKELILEIRVSDSGIGIAKDKQEEIFLRFKRLTPAYQGIYKGLGLGLTTVKQFIDELDGEIYVSSELGQGTTFTCLIAFKAPLLMDETGVEDIPLSKQLNQKTETITEESIPAEDLNPAANRILLVEDNDLAARIAQLVLSGLDCSIDRAADAKTAMELLQQKDYQLIFMDIGLPDMDGITLTHRIRLQQWRRHHATIPIIGLTAHAEQDTKQKCLDAGMNLVIVKPLKKETAQELLATFIKNTTNEKETPTPMNDQIIDFAEVKRFLKDEELIEDCRQLMISGISEDIPKLNQHYQNKNWQEIHKIAHKWQGAASYYAAHRLRESCKQMADATFNTLPPTATLDTLFQHMIAEMQAAKKACEDKK